MPWMPVSPWKLLGTQTQTLGAAAAAFTNNVGTQTRAVMLTVTSQNVRIYVSPGGTVAATATNGPILKTTDPPLVLGVSPGDNVSCLGSGGTVSMTELTH